MKQSIFFAIVLVCAAGMAFAQAGSIGVFTSDEADDCNFSDYGNLIRLFIVHVHTTGATASQFMLQPAPGWAHLSDSWNFPAVTGTSITGVTVIYGGCLSGPISLGEIVFQGLWVQYCTRIEIVPDPTALSGLIEALDCDTPAQTMFPTGGEGIVNGPPYCLCVVPVEETTWGSIKALYE